MKDRVPSRSSRHSVSTSPAWFYSFLCCVSLHLSSTLKRCWRFLLYIWFNSHPVTVETELAWPNCHVRDSKQVVALIFVTIYPLNTRRPFYQALRMHAVERKTNVAVTCGGEKLQQNNGPSWPVFTLVKVLASDLSFFFTLQNFLPFCWTCSIIKNTPVRFRLPGAGKVFIITAEGLECSILKIPFLFRLSVQCRPPSHSLKPLWLLKTRSCVFLCRITPLFLLSVNQTGSFRAPIGEWSKACSPFSGWSD